MYKKLSLLLLFFAALLTACGPAPEEAQPEPPAAPAEDEFAIPESETAPAIFTLKGPTGVSMAYLAGSGEYDVQVAGSPDQVVAALSSGEADIAAIPTNLAAKLYQKTAGEIMIVTINTFGSLYIVENGDTISSVADLRGQTVYGAGQGANPQYILEYLLRSAGLEPGVDVEIVYKSEHSEVAALLAQGEITIGMLPEPNVSAAMSKNAGLRIALDFTAEWEQASPSPLTMGCVAMRREYGEANPISVQAFLRDLQTSTDYARNNISQTAELCSELDIIPSAAVAELAIPNCGLTLISGEDMQPALEGYYQVLLDADPASIGGALPGEDFYYCQ